MKNFKKFIIPSLFLFISALACGTSAPTATAEPTTTVESTIVAPTQPTVEATKTSIPTKAATPTVWPPVFELWSLNDIRSLDSFKVIVNEKNTVNGQLTERTITILYIKEPYTAYRVLEYTGGVDKAFAVGGRTYELTGTGDWYISNEWRSELFTDIEPAKNAGRLVDAKFAGEEQYEGLAAYHFVLDAGASSNPNANSQLQGELYIAKEGNYILFSHWLETTKQGAFSQTFEVTETVSSINQVTEIKMPSEMENMVPTADLPIELGLPLPPDTAFYQMIRYKSGVGVDLYFYTPPSMSIEDFLNFYRNLPPTDGWTVSHIGHVRLHQSDCEFTRECVIINKGTTQVILYYDGGAIRAEFDWPHLFSPAD